MTEANRRRVAGGVAVAGVLLALASVGPLEWGLGMGIIAFVGGYGYAADRRPAQVRRGRTPWNGGPDGR
jgi:hypothetical protein